ncbi:glutaredoxin 2 [Acinetobacter sp. ESL0695]|uniref:glutaredoxin 2 n=1 Tax=Acinetobacter sp. ESL0695 TaxID=2983215 RepID=UPI0023F51325|nr:glutaredoxin 2 [Acinetobacter sp. ESL0695]WEV49769.1 glutaredoxin 2 [Acinetobacter sp. ESL0695]
MRLYIYEHCPFCLRTRMIAGFKNLPIQYSIIMEGDSETPIHLVGKKVVPILQKSDGQYMTESLDIVKYLDDLSPPYYAQGEVNTEIEAWIKKNSSLIFRLIVPRFTQSDFKEISTPEARQAFIERETASFGDLKQLYENSEPDIHAMNTSLTEIDSLIEHHEEMNITDFMIFPWLRSLSIVEGLIFPSHTKRYMNRIATAAKVNLLFDQAR